MPRGRGLATATTSAAFFPHREQRIRSASSLSVIDQPSRRARASGSISRHAPQSQMTRTRNWPKQSSSLLMCVSTRTGASCDGAARAVYSVLTSTAVRYALANTKDGELRMRRQQLFKPPRRLHRARWPP